MKFGIINLHPPRQFNSQRTAILESYATIFNCPLLSKKNPRYFLRNLMEFLRRGEVM